MNNILAPLEWHNEKRKIKDLVPYEYNPRKLTEEKKDKLKTSLEKFNLAEIPAVNTDNVIIAGHQRVIVLLELGRGEEEIDVRIPNRKLTDKEFKQYNITSNIQTGEWWLDMLTENFDDIDLGGLGLDINDIPVDDIPEEFKEEDEEDFEPEIPIVPISKEADFYELISLQKNITHKLICGDSTMPKVYDKLLGNEKASLMPTDPPYNVDYKGAADCKRDGIKNDAMDNDSFYQFLLAFYKASFEYLKEGAPVYVFHADTEGVNFRTAMQDANFKLSQCLIWVKQNFVMGRNDYHWQHEPCLYGWKPGAAHKWYSDRTQSTLLEFDRPSRSDEHPTMKPLPLVSYLVCNSSKQKDIVLDPFSGSGSTLIACEKNWRNCRAIELDPKYVDVGVKRWVKYMKDNNRDFKILKNGQLLTTDKLQILLDNPYGK